MKLINNTYKLFLCITICEINNLKDNIGYIKYLFLNVNIFKYFIYFFDKNINPIKSKNFDKFIKLNEKKWKFSSNKLDNNNDVILIESFLNHQSCAISNMLIGKYLQRITKSKCIGFLRNGDIKAEILFKSFGVNKIYFYKFGGFVNRLKYIHKSLKIFNKIKNIKDLYNLRINKIDIGLLTYDTWIRYTRKPTTNKIKIRLIIFLAQALHAHDFFDKLLEETKTTKLIQAEKQFIPFSILFQKSLQKKITVYSRNGMDKLTVRIYNNFEERHDPKNKFSKKLLSSVYNNIKSQAIRETNKWFKSQIKNKFYGRSWAPFIQNKRHIVNSWKKKIDGIEQSDNLKKNIIKTSKLKDFSKEHLCKKFYWNKNRKIVTVFLPYMIDGIYQNGRKKLFLDNYNWIVGTLKIIKNIKKVNWIIKEHPQEIRYNTKSDYPLVLSEILRKNPHIKNCPRDINPFSLTKITDIALTCNGTAGLEYQSFGIPTIVAEKSYYSHFGFSNRPNNLLEYKKLLNKIHLIRNPSQKQIDKAKVILFVSYILSATEANFLPDNLPQFETQMKLNDEEKYWIELIKKNNKFNFKKDLFKKMLEKQLILKNRHTINFEKYKKLNKKFNDF